MATGAYLVPVIGLVAINATSDKLQR